MVCILLPCSSVAVSAWEVHPCVDACGKHTLTSPSFVPTCVQSPSELEEESDMEDLIRPPRPITPTPSLLSQISTGSDTGRQDNDRKTTSW